MPSQDLRQMIQKRSDCSQTRPQQMPLRPCSGAALTFASPELVTSVGADMSSKNRLPVNVLPFSTDTSNGIRSHVHMVSGFDTHLGFPATACDSSGQSFRVELTSLSSGLKIAAGDTQISLSIGLALFRSALQVKLAAWRPGMSGVRHPHMRSRISVGIHR